EELSYSKSLRMIGTAYTAGIGVVNNIPATGTQVRVGVVAVDKRVIPLGTKLFIEAANGSYIYGTAVAEDTGVRGNVIDLYMNSYEDCVRFGRRDLNVYILD
ncbi:MAG: 3D domain-containing protein, partial [Oscillospiraceae bacterium]|nr:3D domain-containing protein [Oscillospiraceae bacterium]